MLNYMRGKALVIGKNWWLLVFTGQIWLLTVILGAKIGGY